MLDRIAYLDQPLAIKDELVRLFGRETALTIFDIGACEGEDSVRYSRLFPKATIFAFEPLPGNVERAQKTIAAHGSGRIEIMATALSDQDGEATFHVSSGSPPGASAENWDFGNKSSSLLPPERHLEAVPWLKFEQTILAPTLRGDAFCERRRIAKVDYVHLDVQGAERKVLDGFDLKKLGVAAIWTEVANVEMYRGQPLMEDLKRYLGKRGFWLIRLEMEGEVGDALFVRRDRLLLTPKLLFPVLLSKLKGRARRAKAYLQRLV